jgi:molybdenum cofactor cytidylyltransferase
VVLAAGLSRRMGRPKLVLPWGETTVIGRVVRVLAAAGLEEMWIVTGGSRLEVEAALAAEAVAGLRTVFNPAYAGGEMAASLKAGLAALPGGVDAALVVLGDQPQIRPEVAAAVVAAYQGSRAALVVPSYRMRRGHPWLIDRSLWGLVRGLGPGQSPRDLLNEHAASIRYLPVDTPSVLLDLDTPEDYQAQRPS